MLQQRIDSLRLFLLKYPQHELAVMTYQEGATYRKLIANRKDNGTADVTLDNKFIQTIEIK